MKLCLKFNRSLVTKHSNNEKEMLLKILVRLFQDLLTWLSNLSIARKRCNWRMRHCQQGNWQLCTLGPRRVRLICSRRSIVQLIYVQLTYLHSNTNDHTVRSVN